MAQINLNLAGIEAAAPMGMLVPQGIYDAEIVDTKILPFKEEKDGHRLEITAKILSGEYKGCFVYENLNLWHLTNETTVTIAKRQVRSIMDAIGLTDSTLQDDEHLRHRPLSISVTIEKGTGGFADKNRIKGYMAFKNGSAPVAMAPAFVPPAPVAAPAPVAPVAAPAFTPAAPMAAPAPSFAPPAGLPAFAPPAPAAAPQSFAPPAAAPAAAPVPMAPVMAPPPAFAVPGAAPAPMAPAAGAPAPFAWQAQS